MKQNHKNTTVNITIPGLQTITNKFHTPHQSIKRKNYHKTILPNTKRKTPYYIFHDKKSILICGDIEKNPGPKLTFLLNHPQIHQEKYNTYFYKNSIQIKIEYEHIFESFKPYLNRTQIDNTNPHLTQFCTNNQQRPHNYLFFAILITLASIPSQSNQLIRENSIQWTIILINKLINNPTTLPTKPHTLQKFHSENPHITKPLDNIQKEIYSFITTERPNLEILLQKFPYLPD
jgi:hypothetical protein